ncbi:MAG: histidine phosphatase family protein [Kineosporiaceae bacterium]
MPTLLLIRHGRTTANTSGVLAGWSPGVGLDDTGRAQAATLAHRLAAVELARIVVSPLQRCQETLAPVLAEPARIVTRTPSGRERVRAAPRPEPVVDERVGECRYGDWTGRPLKDLAREPLWAVVQAHPSAVTFPGGESLPDMQARMLAAVRDHDAQVRRSHGDDAVWALVSHGDPIKSVLADALGMHLDAFQRVVVDPASVSAVRYQPLRPFVLRVNDTGGDLAALAPPPRKPRRRPTHSSAASSDAPVGGGAGAHP